MKVIRCQEKDISRQENYHQRPGKSLNDGASAERNIASVKRKIAPDERKVVLAV